MRSTLPLEIENLGYGFRDRTPAAVFSDESFSVGGDEFVSLIVKEPGAKTAFLNCVLGNYKPSFGRVHFWGFENRGYQRDQIQQRVGWMISKKEAHAPWIRLDEYLRALSRLYRTWNVGHCQNLVRILGLDFNRRMSDLSPDEAAKVSLVKALSFEPELLVMDEVAANVSIETLAAVREVLARDFRRGKMSVLLISQSEEAARFMSAGLPSRIVTFKSSPIQPSVQI
ncbi:MAG: ATP-binding cassette domain-containing protein [Proteobacteria bacterium]|nr:MAG: ATP-binding cassette domain-containing protein [Pseudomonadota bacterium]